MDLKATDQVAKTLTAPNPTRRLARGDRRRQILQAAVSYFAEMGFEGGTRELANRLGVTQPLIYQYFPSKEDLIREVYNEVYLSRWETEWEDLIRDRSIPLRDRLVIFYQRYTDVVFSTEWMRIYLFSGLRGIEINKWWMNFVETNIITRICEEIRNAYGLKGRDAVPIQTSEIELYWLLQGGIFYHGMRREIYKARVAIETLTFIELSVDSFLLGFSESARHIVDAAAKKRR